MAQPQSGVLAESEAEKGSPGDWNDHEVFGDLSAPASAPSTPSAASASPPSSPAVKALPSEVPETFRPVVRSGSSVAPAEDDDEVPLDTSRFLKKANPWARVGVGSGVALALGILGFAISRGPGHTAAEEMVLATASPHQEAREALLQASMGIGKACGDGKALTTATVRATFMPEGNVLNAAVVGPYAGTPVGECVVAKVRELHSQPFTGLPVTVTEEVSLRPAN